MSQPDRLAYLQAMGVDVWVRRQRSATGPRPATVSAELLHGITAAGSANAPAAVDPAAAITSAAVAPDPAVAADAELIPPAPAQAPTQRAESSTTPEPETPPSQKVQNSGASGQHVEPDVVDSVNHAAEAAPSQVPVTLASLQSEAAACTRCELHTTRLQSVFGQGNPDADWMFVGEAPGAEEDRQGLPFVGPAGKLLDAMLVAIGLEREQVYIANLVKCRPPRNRDPQTQELASCESYIRGQLEIIQPRIIIALGRFAAQSLTQSTESIGRLRGSQHTHAPTGIPIIATYHPAYLLRSPAEKGKVWRDLLRARATIANGD